MSLIFEKYLVLEWVSACMFYMQWALADVEKEIIYNQCDTIGNGGAVHWGRGEGLPGVGQQ